MIVVQHMFFLIECSSFFSCSEKSFKLKRVILVSILMVRNNKLGKTFHTLCLSSVCHYWWTISNELSWPLNSLEIWSCYWILNTLIANFNFQNNFYRPDSSIFPMRGSPAHTKPYRLALYWPVCFTPLLSSMDYNFD